MIKSMEIYLILEKILSQIKNNAFYVNKNHREKKNKHTSKDQMAATEALNVSNNVIICLSKIKIALTNPYPIIRFDWSEILKFCMTSRVLDLLHLLDFDLNYLINFANIKLNSKQLTFTKEKRILIYKPFSF